MADVNVCGLVCPEPVLLIKRKIETKTQGTITVIADSEVAVKNIERIASNMGWSVSIERTGDQYFLTLTK